MSYFTTLGIESIADLHDEHQWQLVRFADGKKIYCESGKRVYIVPEHCKRGHRKRAGERCVRCLRVAQYRWKASKKVLQELNTLLQS